MDMFVEMMRAPVALALATGTFVAMGKWNNKVHNNTIKAATKACEELAQAKYVLAHPKLARAVAALEPFSTTSHLRKAYVHMVRQANSFARASAALDCKKMALVYGRLGTALDVWVQLLPSGSICIEDVKGSRQRDFAVVQANPDLARAVRVGMRRLPLGKAERMWVRDICSWMLDRIEATYKMQVKSLRNGADALLLDWRKSTANMRMTSI